MEFYSILEKLISSGNFKFDFKGEIQILEDIKRESITREFIIIEKWVLLIYIFKLIIISYCLLFIYRIYF